MTEYRLQMQTMTAGIPWEYSFTSASDEMARDYTRRILNEQSWPRSCMSIELFNMEKGHICGFKLTQPIVEERRGN